MSRVTDEQARDICQHGTVGEVAIADLADDLLDSRAECERLQVRVRLVEFCAQFGHPPEKIDNTGKCTRCGYVATDQDSAATCERLRAKLAEAVEALRPFARAGADPAWKDYPDSYPMWIRASGESYAALEDLRRAARVVDGAK